MLKKGGVSISFREKEGSLTISTSSREDERSGRQNGRKGVYIIVAKWRKTIKFSSLGVSVPVVMRKGGSRKELQTTSFCEWSLILLSLYLFLVLNSIRKQVPVKNPESRTHIQTPPLTSYTLPHMIFPTTFKFSVFVTQQNNRRDTGTRSVNCKESESKGLTSHSSSLV